MRLWSGISEQFIHDAARNRIAEHLKAAFFENYRYSPPPSEVNSWRNSLRAFKDVLEMGELRDQGMLLEYQLPSSSRRLDAILCGRDSDRADSAVIVELKQWERCETTEPENLVCTWIGGAQRDVLHPSVQVGQYKRYLADSHTAFHEGPEPVRLAACGYLHNYRAEPDDPLLDSKFRLELAEHPLFDVDGAEALCEFLVHRTGARGGAEVLARLERSKARQSIKLMEHVGDAIKVRSPWVLLDEQLVVFERIRSTALFNGNEKKRVILVRGGPGTGKSVLAINLVAEFLRAKCNTYFATGSKAFTETMWSILGPRSKSVFKYFNSFGSAESNEVDVLICDEAHRIRETSNNRFTKAINKSKKPQVRELVDSARVSVFFVDDRQVVRPNEIGSSQLVRDAASEVSAELREFELDVQFRCAGSDGFVNWIENTLGIRRTANVLWTKAEGFDFRILRSPVDLEREILARAEEGASARLAAGFCWPWSEPKDDGSLEKDVVVGEFRRPWNARPEARRLAKGIPRASLWATDPAGIGQVGCVYTIQGFEVDYVGVIWGPDLVYDFNTQSWVGRREHSRDTVVRRSRESFLELVKNTYRVLLSRGMKGCYLHIMDPDTERFVRSRIESSDALGGSQMVAETPPLSS